MSELCASLCSENGTQSAVLPLGASGISYGLKWPPPLKRRDCPLVQCWLLCPSISLLCSGLCALANFPAVLGFTRRLYLQSIASWSHTFLRCLLRVALWVEGIRPSLHPQVHGS
jgi:hypothetical protein|uniref:Uncharacterized protein n=1 Tax=Mus musculus TaxID=10090 RepID=Q3ULC1_MOUSE|nr:unnamed protein product [Mus musculus]